MEYRVSFFLQTAANLLITCMEFAAIWAVLGRFGNIRGWTLPEICFFYGTANAAFAIGEGISRGFDQFAAFVRGGEFDRVLLRPCPTVMQLLGHEITLRRVGRLAQALTVIGFGFAWMPQTLMLPNVALLAWAISCGVLLFTGILILQATICFWTTESIEMMNVLTYGAVFSSQYPLSIYRGWFRKFFTFMIPLAGVVFLPVLGVLGISSGWQIWVAPLCGPIFLLAALQIWRFGVRRYCSTGS
ncbi:MAG TPA: ABC-2 family transporter protein [Chthoniobacterales bacterium]